MAQLIRTFRAYLHYIVCTTDAVRFD